jgi:hypothetical protein
MGSRPKAPKPTAEELALEKRTMIGLRESRAKTERMLKSQARGQLGVKSLLGGIKPMRNLQKDVVHSDAMSSERRDDLERKVRTTRGASKVLYSAMLNEDNNSPRSKSSSLYKKKRV